MPDNQHDLIVLGGGPGGYAAAFLAADKGIDVALVDPEPNPGGTCLYRGCIPSKALLHVMKVIGDARDAAAFGVSYPDPSIDLDKLRAWKRGVVDKLTGGLGQLAKQRKVKHIRGRGQFNSAHELTVDLVDRGTETLGFEHCILATGSVPARFRDWPTDSPRILFAKHALDLPEIPGSLLVVGGGYIGLELGSVYAALGTKVTVVEMLDSLLPGVDRDLVRPLHRRLSGIFEGIHLETKVASIETGGKRVRVQFEGKGADDARKQYDCALVAIGRTANSRGIGLENTRVATNSRGFVEVDDKRRTAEPSIYAIGDVAGEPMLAHKASHEGRVAVEAIAGEKAAGWDPRAIPAVVFTDPEVAWAGLSEQQAKQQGRDVQVVKFPWAASGRAATLNRSDGVSKLIVDAESKLVLGAGITGANAGDLIAEAVLAIEMGCVADDLRFSIHPHPTLSETLMESAALIYNESPHFLLPRRKS
ncbi:MAG: Dihydrolipoyl dehydrogenase [Calditrichaeota bacterium]|nr:Dihydrolipoyl dehydrogenase [Calditrichota bacterium]